MNLKKTTAFLIILACFCCVNELRSEDRESRKTAAKEETTTVSPFHQKGFFELGGVAGMPSGINVRYWFTDFLGIDSAIGASINRDFAWTMDLLYENIELTSNDTMRLRFFFGGGTLLGTDDHDFTVSLRVPLGLSMPFENTPVNLSIYAAPSMTIKPESSFDVNFGIAARYNFGTASEIKNGYEARLAAAYNGLEESRHQLDSLNNSLNQTISELDRTRNELDSARGHLQSTRQNLDSTRERLMATKGELDQTRGKLDQTQQELATTKVKLDTTESTLSSIKKELDDAKEKLDVTKNELEQTKKELDDREKTFREKQAELDILKNIARNAYTGEKRKEEEKKIADQQAELDRQKKEFEEKKDQWKEKNRTREAQYIKFKERCEARRGVINEEGYCSCRQHETWNSDRSSCVCIRGYSLNRSSDRCEPCETVDYYGNCVTRCKSDEKRVRLGSGPHTYVCVKRCSGKNETWSERRGECVCEDGYYRNSSGACVKRR